MRDVPFTFNYSRFLIYAFNSLSWLLFVYI
nr:MAG TPA: hypothetical protein [Caudoviricetes sp.]